MADIHKSITYKMEHAGAIKTASAEARGRQCPEPSERQDGCDAERGRRINLAVPARAPRSDGRTRAEELAGALGLYMPKIGMYKPFLSLSYFKRRSPAALNSELAFQVGVTPWAMSRPTWNSSWMSCTPPLKSQSLRKPSVGW